jgi:hypothetical protein
LRSWCVRGNSGCAITRAMREPGASAPAEHRRPPHWSRAGRQAARARTLNASGSAREDDHGEALCCGRGREAADRAGRRWPLQGHGGCAQPIRRQAPDRKTLKRT